MVSILRFDLNLLRTLDAVLSERNVARAAERLNVTASAVSNALARLRHELDDPLVVRNGRGVVPTPRASALAPALREALLRLEGSVRNESFDPTTTARRFTLALADAGQITHLPMLSCIMAVDMPCASLRVVGIETFLSLGGPASGEIDVAIARFDGDTPGIHSCALYEERSVLVARRGHVVARKRLTKAKLALLRHVDVEVAPGRGYRGLDESYSRLGIRRAIAMVVPSFVAAAAVVAETECVATLPVSLVETLKARFDLVPIKGEAPTPLTRLSLIWHERTHTDPASRAFRVAVKRAFGGH
jgi:DNA-binding transcriptional LysR family regulator